MKFLKDNKNTNIRGLEISKEKVQECIAKGLTVIEGNAEKDLKQFPDKSFDCVILSQTLQAFLNPELVLNELLRVGKKAIITIPNFGYWKVRFHLLLKGTMPITKTLPDDSEVTLNALSAISFNEKQWSTQRSVTLDGEAFFEVTKGNTFTVNTDMGEVTVLGTSFNVFNRETDFSVTCFSGSVQVKSNDDQVILKPGQKTRIDKQSGRLTVQDFNPQQSATWRIGEFYFDAVELTMVIRELERQFDIKIEVTGDISDRFYSGFFSTQSLEEALKLVFVPMGLSSHVNGSIVTVE